MGGTHFLPAMEVLFKLQAMTSNCFNTHCNTCGRSHLHLCCVDKLALLVILELSADSLLVSESWL